MRHRVYGKILGRDKNQRNILFRGLVEALIIQEKIETTQAKAKAISGLVDKVVNLAKSTTAKRLVSQFLTHKKTLEKLEKEILPKLKTRNSGYSSITKLGKRLGDGAMMVSMKLLLEESKEAKVSRGERVSQVPQGEELNKNPRDTRGTIQPRGTAKKGNE